MADQLWERARADLLVRTPGASPDTLLWEHACRVERLSRLIVDMPEVPAESIDAAALELAALYHDAGWKVQIEAGDVHPRDLLLRPTSDIQRELAADWILTQLGGVVAENTLQVAARIIRQCNDRQSRLPEAQVLADAENLDEIGPQTIAIMVRKQIAEGRTLADLVAAWERQEEYHYWQARIKECFRFASVRPLAEHRWQVLRRFMKDLRDTLSFNDMPIADAADVRRGSRAESV